MRNRRKRCNGLTLVDVLTLVVIIGCVFVFFNFMQQRSPYEDALYKSQCASNLKQIYVSAMGYSDQSGTGMFPFGPGPRPRAHESLNALFEFHADELPPGCFSVLPVRPSPRRRTRPDSCVLRRRRAATPGWRSHSRAPPWDRSRPTSTSTATGTRMGSTVGIRAG